MTKIVRVSFPVTLNPKASMYLQLVHIYKPLHVSMCNAYLQVRVCWSQLGQMHIVGLFTVFVDVYNNVVFICNYCLTALSQPLIPLFCTLHFIPMF